MELGSSSLCCDDAGCVTVFAGAARAFAGLLLVLLRRANRPPAVLGARDARHDETIVSLFAHVGTLYAESEGVAVVPDALLWCLKH